MVFHREKSYSTTPTPFRDRGISPMLLLDPYFHGLASPFGHSNHRHLIDPRPNAHSHLWLAMPYRSLGIPRIERAHIADFTELLTLTVSSQRQSEYQGRRFRALPHHSTYRNISYCSRHCRKPLIFNTARSFVHRALFPVKQWLYENVSHFPKTGLHLFALHECWQ